MTAEHSGNKRPPSATNCWLNAIGAATAVGVMLHATARNLPIEIAMLLCALALAAPIIVGDLLLYRVYKRPSAGLSRDARQAMPNEYARVATKLLGLWATLAIIAAAYWLFPEYRGDYFKPFFRLAVPALPILALLSIPYFFLVDRRMDDPHDGYWHTGRLCLGVLPQDRQAWTKLREHILGWTIKAFFLPLMTVFLAKNLQWMIEHPPQLHLENFRLAVHWWITLAFFLDVSFAFVGYTLTLRIFDSHIRSSNPLLLGWGVALMCYPPFWALFESHYLGYNTPPNWEGWLANSPAIYVLWGSALIFLIAVYAWATVAFGLRFSNLTHRGILTGGPYRFTKHPAYVAKNLYWWLAAVPFIPDSDWQQALRACLMLAMVNIIYYLRARTEEQHLASDPDYVAYAQWIDRHGLFAFLGRMIPPLRFRTPAAATPSG